MTRVPPHTPLALALADILGSGSCPPPPAAEIFLETLPSSRQVRRVHFPGRGAAVVGKFFGAYPPQTASDRSLAQEYGNYLRAAVLGLANGAGIIPRLLGRRAEVGLGLLLEDIPGPSLDHLLLQACAQGQEEPLRRGLEHLAGLLAFFHTRAVPEGLASPVPALIYLAKLTGQLEDLGLLTPADHKALEEEQGAWEPLLARFPDRQVLVHGDATPTNFLFPHGQAVALDLERLWVADRLWDLSWVTGELKHAWGWRANHLDGAEEWIRHFFRAYLAALPPDPALASRIYALNPFYMALAELRIARNTYLPWNYRRELVAEARRCLAGGRRR